MTQPKDIEGLRKVAEEATKGPWSRSGVRQKWTPGYGRTLDSHVVGPEDNKGWVALIPYDERNHTEDLATANFIATFDPPTVLALLSELEAVKGENARLETEVLNAAFSDRLDMEAGGSPLTWKEIALSAEAALVSLKGGGGSSGGRVQAAPDGATEAPHSAGVEHLDPTRWEVTVHVDGTNVLTIGSHGYLAGFSEIDRFGDAVRAAGEHLLSFIGTGEPTPCFACGGSGQERWVGYGGNEEVGPCPVCGGSPEDQELPI